MFGLDGAGLVLVATSDRADDGAAVSDERVVQGPDRDDERHFFRVGVVFELPKGLVEGASGFVKAFQPVPAAVAGFLEERRLLESDRRCHPLRLGIAIVTARGGVHAGLAEDQRLHAEAADHDDDQEHQRQEERVETMPRHAALGAPAVAALWRVRLARYAWWCSSALAFTAQSWGRPSK